MKYAHIIETKLHGWYDDSIHSEIPTPNIEVTDEVWQEALRINANCYENGEFIVKDFRTDEEIEAQRIASIKVKANELIEEKYPLYKQNNILMSGITADIANMNQYITNIRNTSNEAETNGTALKDINWGI